MFDGEKTIQLLNVENQSGPKFNGFYEFLFQELTTKNKVRTIELSEPQLRGPVISTDDRDIKVAEYTVFWIPKFRDYELNQ